MPGVLKSESHAVSGLSRLSQLMSTSILATTRDEKDLLKSYIRQARAVDSHCSIVVLARGSSRKENSGDKSEHAAECQPGI